MEKAEEMYDLCVFKGCPNEAYTWGKSLFPFPHITNPMLEIWLENCGNRSILGRSDLAIKKFGLCSDHFTPDSFYDEGNKRLREDAIPEPYSPTFKRPHFSVKSNANIYDHNYAVVSSGMSEILLNYGQRTQYPLRRYNARNYSVPSAPADAIKNHNNINQANNGPKTKSTSPRLKREKPLAKAHTRKSLDFDINDGRITSASSSVEAFGNKNSVGSSRNVSRLAADAKNSNSTSVNSSSSSNINILGSQRRRAAIGSESKVQRNDSRAGESVFGEGEVGILKKTNFELKAQNNLLKKLNGQLKLKLKRCEDRNKVLKASLETASSVDGFLDLHLCNNLDVRNSIKAQIHKCKMPSGGKIK